MGTGYTRNDTANNIADGNVINAADFDGEYDAIEAAFNSSTGHTHDGTAAEGGPITVLGPSQEFVANSSAVNPSTNAGLDLGTSSLKFNDLYIDGTAYIDGLGGNLLIDTTNALQFRDAQLNISSSADGQLDIDADTTVEIDSPEVIVTDDFRLQSDSSVLTFGADDDITLTHNHDTGLNAAAASGFTFAIQTNDISVDNGNNIGSITFNAPLEDSGSNANLVGASIEATAEATFSSTDNATALIFNTNTSGAATERMRIKSDGDVVFTGASANMSWDTSEDSLDFADNAQISVGTGDDLVITHDATNSSITNTTGELFIQGDAITLRSDTGTEKYIEMDVDGAVGIYYDNVKTIETASDGVDITGNLDVGNFTIDTNTISSTDSNGDINLSPDGTGTVVINTDLDVDNINIDGNTITSTDTNGDINLSPNGTGTVVINTDLDIDNVNINGNTINATTGALNLQTTSNGNIDISPNGTGVVNIAYNGATVIATSSTGAAITGTLTATSVNAPLASTATAITQAANDNSTKIATTAYVDAAASGTGASSEDSALALAIALG